VSGLRKQTAAIATRNYVGKWIESIKDEELRKVVAENTIITGGSIASMLLGEKVNDYDIYFKTKEVARQVALYYVAQFNADNFCKVGQYVAKPYTPVVKETTVNNILGEEEERIVIYMKSAGFAEEEQDKTYEYFEGLHEERTLEYFYDDPMQVAEDVHEELKPKKERFRPVFLSDNAITLSDRIQIIIRFWGDPATIHRTFDFAHAMCYYDYGKREIVCPPEALESLLAKNLIYKGSLYPVASLFRIRKFMARGWKISAGQILKIIMQLQGVDLKDPAVLKEQLMGVDVAYMYQLISELQKTEGRVDSTYLANLIDKVFEE
jgi:hypothetical protein